MAITVSAAKAPSAVNPLEYRLTASETTNGWTNSDNHMALRRISLSANPLIINQEFNLSFEARITTDSSKGHLRRQHLYLAFFDSDGVNIGSLSPIGNGAITQKVITMDAGSWYRFQVNGLVFDSLQNAKSMRLRFGGTASDETDAKPSVYVSINMGFDSSGELQRIGTHQSGTSITDANRTAVINYVTTKNIYYAINHNFRINDLTIERNKTNKTTIDIEFDVVATCQKDYIPESTETYNVFLYENSVKAGYSGQISGVAHGQDHTHKFTLSATLALSSSANYYIVVSDNYGNEVTSQTIKIQRGDAIVNLHLCGTSKGGISIGRENTEDYSSSSYVPKFESHFPTVFYDGIYGIDNYSLDEVCTGSKWINGKKIYKKTFAKAGLSTNGTTPYTERGRIENIDEVINIEGITYGSVYQFPLPYESAAETINTGSRYTHGAFIRVTDESDAENHDGIVYYIKQPYSDMTAMMATIWYTKTTDY